MHRLLAVLFSALLVAREIQPVLNDSVEELTSAAFDDAVKNTRYLLMLFYEPDCESCALGLDTLASVTIPDSYTAEVKRVKIDDKNLASRYGIKDLPAIIFFRDSSPAVYDGKLEPAELAEWLYLVQAVVTQTLTDDSFEHLTQAATGATTGDWLVAFTSSACSTVLPALETAALRLRQTMNTANVQITTSPKLIERFAITKCPTFLLFRQGKMYRGDINLPDPKALVSFATTWYKNLQAESVPREKTGFDRLTETIAKELKARITGPQGRLYLLGIAGVAVLITLILVLLLCCGKSSSPKQKRE